MDTNPAKMLYGKFEAQLNNRKPVQTEDNGFFKKPVRPKEATSIEHLYDIFSELRKGREDIKNARTNL